MSPSPIPIEALLEHRPWVRAVAAAVVRDPNAADDVEQDAWLAALTAPPRHTASLRGWLGAVVRNRARRFGRGETRRARRETSVARAEATRSTADLAEIADTHRRVVQAVVELDEPYRATILLRFFEGLPIDEVARQTGAPLETTRARLRRGVARLRERLSREAGADDRPWQFALAPLIGPAPLFVGSSSTCSTASSKVTGGIIAMAGKGTIAATGAALVVGTAAGWWFGAGASHADERQHVATESAGERTPEAASARPKDGRRESSRTSELEAELRAAHDEAAALRARVDEMQSRTPQPVVPAAATKEAPRIAFDRFPKLAEIDWRSVGRSIGTMASLVRDIAAARAAGEKPSAEKLGSLDKENGALIAAAMPGVQELPGTYANSSFTHPAFVVNAIVATLEFEGKPLTPAETTALERIARELCDEDARRLAGYDASTLALQKIVDECDLRRRFLERAFAALTEEQRDALSPPAVRGTMGGDLFGDGLVLQESLHPLPYKEGDVDALTSDVVNAVDSKLRLTDAQRPYVRGQVAEWLRTQPPASAPTSKAGSRTQVEDVRVAARRTLTLLRVLLADGKLEASQVEAVRQWEDALLPQPKPRD